uniref:ZP domain-containing protein n=1 Tax=Gongylonema pulchrum TaxID=637853 RepID=A0A183DTS6_9BILA
LKYVNTTKYSFQVAGIELPFDSCNVARSRSLNPRGIYVSAVVVITFHPQFITKVDRAYRIQCFYMEADKTVSTQIEVSDITTAFQTQVVPMPICRYEILEGGPTGSPIKYALIGQQVYHKWTCDSETVDTFCAVVHSCFVDDGNGDTVEILDESGCALDKYLLNNLEYPTVKEPNTDCPRPQCAEPQGFGAVKSAAAPAPAALALAPRNLRLIRKRSVDYDNTVDVRTEFSAVDISEEVCVLQHF